MNIHDKWNIKAMHIPKTTERREHIKNIGKKGVIPFAAVWVVVRRSAVLRMGSQAAVGDCLVPSDVQPSSVTKNISTLQANRRQGHY